MKNYVVRFYRRDERRGGHIAGMVETPESGERFAFKSQRGLMRILLGRGGARDNPALATDRRASPGSNERNKK